ncbi:hypothetical protein KHA80_15795 [Anaerobacillus sp. HL2]|nr:hypothetical protein KHA80_15795 [Anaerobacillus sp. HL2]
MSVNTINEDNGAIKFTIGQIQDITEKKRTEAKLIESEKKDTELLLKIQMTE